ncbi:MAG: NADH-quinone oxidoreductase subunit E, partial [Rikenellaceae bacterium]|nr:NADH-quinone oxidoreductase subunit E [Rikenellaceae bacterium]
MQIILTLALLTPLVFLVPRRFKVWFTLALVGAGAALALGAAGRVLAGSEFASGEALQWRFHTLFGPQYATLDTISAIFVIIICIGALAVTLYSRGYIAAVGGDKPGPHISLHYMCLGLLFFSMLGVVTSHGGYSFLIFWELMTISSFALIL